MRNEEQWESIGKKVGYLKCFVYLTFSLFLYPLPFRVLLVIAFAGLLDEDWCIKHAVQSTCNTLTYDTYNNEETSQHCNF